MDEPDARSGDPPLGEESTPATNTGDVSNELMREGPAGSRKNQQYHRGSGSTVDDAQSAHDSGNPETGPGVRGRGQPTEEGLKDRGVTYEEVNARLTGAGHHESVQEKGTASPQVGGGVTDKSADKGTHTVPQPLRPEDLYTTLVHEMKDAPGAALREAWQVTVVYLFAEVHNSIPAQRERLSPQKAQYLKRKHAERGLILTIAFTSVSIAIRAAAAVLMTTR
ncbi:unnamed protein product [Peronospora destructor]|uniref:Uncharacterized protein n=1 Tax=Peronospora destructor TaxID=86335 RepID=A0AAV0TKS7_9STRA|nr:unnamed protein product [Peronospora destructor]